MIFVVVEEYACGYEQFKERQVVYVGEDKEKAIERSNRKKDHRQEYFIEMWEDGTYVGDLWD